MKRFNTDILATTEQLVTKDTQGFTREAISSMAANAVRVMQTTGNKIAVYTGSGVTLRLLPTGQIYVLDAGVAVQVQDFNRVEIINGSSIQDVVVYAGKGDYSDGRSNFTATVTATLTPSTTLIANADVSIAAGAQGLVSAGLSTKREVLISNPVTNTVSFRIGDTATLDATHGVLLDPGQSIVLTTAAAIYAYNAGGTTESISSSQTGI